jgi:hypothetical protein
MDNSYTLGTYISLLQAGLETLYKEYLLSKTTRVFDKQILDSFKILNSQIDQYIAKAKEIHNQLNKSPQSAGGVPTFANIKKTFKTFARPNNVEITPLYKLLQTLISTLKTTISLPNRQPGKYNSILVGLTAIKMNNKLIIQQLNAKMKQRRIELVDYEKQAADHERILTAMSRRIHTGYTPRTASISLAELDSHSPISSPRSSFGMSPRASTRRSPGGSLKSTHITVKKVAKSRS